MAEKKFFRVTEWIFAVAVMIVILVDLVLDNRFYYVCKNNCVVPNLAFFIVFLIIFTIIFFNGKIRSDKAVKAAEPGDFKVMMNVLKILTVLLFGASVYYAALIYFETGWDCRSIVIMAQDMAFNGAHILDEHYFSLYPNNVFLTGIFAGILIVVKSIGIKAVYFPLIIVGCLLVSLTGYFFADCVRILTGKKPLVVIFWILYVILTGLSPWVSIPYSDTYSIFFPTFAVWLFLRKKPKSFSVSWLFITLTLFIGYFIKPTVILTFIVLLFFEIFHFFATIRSNGAGKNILKALLFVVVVSIGTISAFLLRSGMERITGFEPDETRSVTPAHYFMMGLNEEYGGAYNQGDVNRSFAYETVEERNKEDMIEAGRRIISMLPVRIFKFEAQKMLTNFNDGTYGWGNEGDFYWTYYERDDAPAVFLRSLVYHIGDNHDIYVAIMQGFWFITLCMCALTVLKRRDDPDYRENAIMIVMLAIMCFLTVFEARARYLYLYSPIIYMVAAVGMNRLLSLKTRTDTNEEFFDK